MKLSFCLLLVGVTAAFNLDTWEDILLQEPTSSDDDSTGDDGLV